MISLVPFSYVIFTIGVIESEETMYIVLRIYTVYI